MRRNPTTLGAGAQGETRGFSYNGNRGDSFIDINPGVTDATAFAQVMSHEIGHTFGLADCNGCAQGSSAMTLPNSPSSGTGPRFTIAAAPASVAGPPSLSATAGDHDGEIDLSWEPVPKAKSYVIEKSTDPPTATSWQHAGVSTKSSATIDGLTPGTRYWFRVAAVGTAGQSGWSAPASKIAP